MIPKSVAIPARPEAYPCPTARTFQDPWRRYNSTSTSAVSTVSPTGSKRASSAPRRSLTETCSAPTVAKVDGPEPSRLPVMTTLSMSAGTSPSANSSAEGGRRRTPGPVGWLKNTKSASERTLPPAVTSNAAMSSGVDELISTRTSLVDNGAFAPLLSTCAMAASTSGLLGASGRRRRAVTARPCERPGSDAHSLLGSFGSPAPRPASSDRSQPEAADRYEPTAQRTEQPGPVCGLPDACDRTVPATHIS